MATVLPNSNTQGKITSTTSTTSMAKTADEKFSDTMARLNEKKKADDEAYKAALPSQNAKLDAMYQRAVARSGPYNQTGGGGTSDRADRATLTQRLRSYSDPDSPLRQVYAGLKEQEAKAAVEVSQTAQRDKDAAAQRDKDAAAAAAKKEAEGTPTTPPPVVTPTTPPPVVTPTTPTPVVKPIPLQGGSAQDMTTGTPTPVVPTVPGAQASFFGKPLTPEEKARKSALDRLTGKV